MFTPPDAVSLSVGVLQCTTIAEQSGQENRTSSRRFPIIGVLSLERDRFACNEVMRHEMTADSQAARTPAHTRRLRSRFLTSLASCFPGDAVVAPLPTPPEHGR